MKKQRWFYRSCVHGGRAAWEIRDTLRGATHYRRLKHWSRADVESFVDHLNSRG